MTTQLNVKELVNEVFGEGYYELTNRINKDIQTTERNAKLTVIQDINKCRQLMGDKPCVDQLFYNLYDKSLSVLQATLVEFEDTAYHYAREKGLLNKNHK